MVQLLLLLTGALVVGAIVFGVAVLIGGGEGLGDVEPDGRSAPLPGARPLLEGDFRTVQFDTALRGYRMSQVDHALKRAAYDIGYKSELIQVLESEVTALRDGRMDDANALRDARHAALGGSAPSPDAPAEASEDAAVSEAGEAAVDLVKSTVAEGALSPEDPEDLEAEPTVTADETTSVKS